MTLLSESKPSKRPAAVLPTGIGAIREIGVQQWHEDCFWPISEADFHVLLDRIWDEFDIAFGGLEDTAKDIVFSDLKFVNHVGQHIHALAVAAWCKENGVALQTDAQSRRYYEPNWTELGGINRRAHSVGNKLRFQLRRFAKRFVFNREYTVIGRLLRLARLNPDWSLGSFDELKRDYVTEHRMYCDHPYIETLAPLRLEGIDFDPRWSSALTSALDRFLTAMQGYCREQFGAELDTAPILAAWNERLRPLWQLYAVMLEINHPPRRMLLSDIGNPLHRAISFSLKAKGTEIIGFAHGNNFGFTLNRGMLYSQHAPCSIYVCQSEQSARYRQGLTQAFPICRPRTMRSIAANTGHYRDLWLTEQAFSKDTPIKTVMLMGSEMPPMRFTLGSGEFFAIKFDLELRLANTLKCLGYNVIYKAHPETKLEIQGIFDELVDHVEVNPFEAVHREADAYLFTNPLTTPFGFALCTSRPVLMIDVAGRDWNHEGYQLLKQRCHMIPATFDARNRIDFSETSLSNALRTANASIDYSYIHEYAFPTETKGQAS
jgi:hypothetical protein